MQNLHNQLACLWRLSALTLFSTLLVACSSAPLMSLKTGDSEARAIKLAGEPPHAIYENADGSRQLEFSNQPDQLQTFMVTLAPNGSVRRVEQVLSSEQLARVKAGMSADAVLRLLGTPVTAKGRTFDADTIWLWTVERLTPSRIRQFRVTLNEGLVVDVDELSKQDDFYAGN